MSRLYLAGGPEDINNWAQQLIREHDKTANESLVESARIPKGVRTFLPGSVTVGPTIWSDVVRLRIELGGGFHHYGVVVYPPEMAPPSEWWQRLLGWPPEVEIYHE